MLWPSTSRLGFLPGGVGMPTCKLGSFLVSGGTRSSSRPCGRPSRPQPMPWPRKRRRTSPAPASAGRRTPSAGRSSRWKRGCHSVLRRCTRCTLRSHSPCCLGRQPGCRRSHGQGWSSAARGSRPRESLWTSSEAPPPSVRRWTTCWTPPSLRGQLAALLKDRLGPSRTRRRSTLRSPGCDLGVVLACARGRQEGARVRRGPLYRALLPCRYRAPRKRHEGDRSTRGPRALWALHSRRTRLRPRHIRGSYDSTLASGRNHRHIPQTAPEPPESPDVQAIHPTMRNPRNART